MRREGRVVLDEAGLEAGGAGEGAGRDEGASAPAHSSELRSPLPPAVVVVVAGAVGVVASVALSGVAIGEVGSASGVGVGLEAGSTDTEVGPGMGPKASAEANESASSIGAPATATDTTASTDQVPGTATAGGNGDRRSDEGAGAEAPSSLSAPSVAPPASSPASSSTTRPSRRTYRDEPIEPEMVEADTERAGDFLEGLLDALDVDGDITTWVDEVGGHIDLEGSDLEILVGSNGETLDALQELTRLAVLRQSKRRARLLLDINGFRARQRDQLVSIVKATAEQVIRTREDHEFQPMTPAERKIVHDAVAAIDGVRTESLGEDPHRRVIVRPA